MNKLKTKSRFIIENILCSDSKSSVTTKSKIGKNFLSEKYSFEILHTIDEKCPKEIEVCAYDDEHFGPSDRVNLRQIFWIKNIRLADDIHGANVFLDINLNTLQLKTSKEIDQHEELQLWFSENILDLMEIPFLTPMNIQGKNSYVCHKCCNTFEVPNQLKIHLALNCSRHTITDLWRKLHVRLEAIHGRKTNQIYPLTMFHALATDKPTLNYDPLLITQHLATSTPLNDTSMMAAAHLETIVSNMGSNKNHQGHLCLYCGKLYSRKYGLKIHIRTHTGFKPLKCRHCFRAFGDPSNLNKHVKLHANQNSNSNFTTSKSSHAKHLTFQLDSDPHSSSSKSD